MKTAPLGCLLIFSCTMVISTVVHGADGVLIGTTEDPGAHDDHDSKNEIPTDQVIVINNDVIFMRSLVRGLLNDAAADGTWVIVTTTPNPYSGIASFDGATASLVVNGSKVAVQDAGRTFSGSYHITAVIAGAKPKECAGEYRWVVTGELDDHPRNWSPSAVDLIKTNPIFANPGMAIVRYNEAADGCQRFASVIPIPADWASFVPAAWSMMAAATQGEAAHILSKLHAEANPLLAMVESHALAGKDVISAMDFAFAASSPVKASWMFAALTADLSPFVSVADENTRAHWDDLAKTIGKVSIDRHVYEYYIGIKASRNQPQSKKYNMTWYADELTSLFQRSKGLPLDAGEYTHTLLPVLRFDYGRGK